MKAQQSTHVRRDDKITHRRGAAAQIAQIAQIAPNPKEGTIVVDFGMDANLLQIYIEFIQNHAMHSTDK